MVVASLAESLAVFNSPPPTTAAVVATVVLKMFPGMAICLTMNPPAAATWLSTTLPVAMSKRVTTELHQSRGPERRTVRIESQAEPAIVARRIVSANEMAGRIQSGNHAKVGNQHSAAGSSENSCAPPTGSGRRALFKSGIWVLVQTSKPFHIGALRCVIQGALVRIENNVTRSAILNGNAILASRLPKESNLNTWALQSAWPT